MHKDAIDKAYTRLKEHVVSTPIITSNNLNALVAADLFFKCENFQITHSFKFRGALHAILQLSETQKEKGVVTHSSGNFAQALAKAAKIAAIPAFIIMPKNTPAYKKEKVKIVQPNVTFCEPTLKAREATAKAITNKTKAVFIHPSNAINVIIGNATITKEFLEAQPNLHTIVAPVGGGGLLAGTALSSHYYGKNCTAIGAEPEAVNDAYRSLQSGVIETNSKKATTIADGLRTNLGSVNFPIIKKYVSSIYCVSEAEIKNALQLIERHLKIKVEPSSAVALAAVLKQKTYFKNKKVGILLSGGNVP